MSTEPALQGRVAVVTGAGRGLGREIARAFARAGAKLVLAARSESELDAVALELKRLGCHVLPKATDVTDTADVEALIAAPLERWGRVDILVNNAGLTHGAAGRKIATILDVEDWFWESTFATNVRGPFLTMRAVMPAMLGQHSGVVINITSSLSHRAIEGNVPYGTSKAALEAMTLSVESEFGQHGVRVNLLHPGGPVDTGIFNDTYRPRPGSELLRPEIIGPPAVWLASDAAADIHGQVINARSWTEERKA